MKDRILQLIEHLNVSVREFEIKCGLSNGYVKAMRKSLGVDKLENVLKAYPNVNRDWLISGEGTMLRTDATSESREEAEMEETDLVRELRRQLEEERRKNEELQKDGRPAEHN